MFKVKKLKNNTEKSLSPNKKKGFTLAELLVTLSVIGIIAALTIPALITRIQEQLYHHAWKNSFSNFSQVTTKLLNENGGSLIGVFQDYNDFMEKYAEKMNYTKKCGPDSGCWHDFKVIKGLNGSPDCAPWGNPGFILQDGTLVRFDFANTSCTYDYFGNYSIPQCGDIWVDVNGFKGPNVIGIDIYRMIVRKNSIVAQGAAGSGVDDLSDCNSSSCGYSCSAIYLKQ